MDLQHYVRGCLKLTLVTTEHDAYTCTAWDEVVEDVEEKDVYDDDVIIVFIRSYYRLLTPS